MSDGYLLDSNNPQILFSRYTPGPDSDTTKPTIEIAFDYQTWNATSGSSFDMDPTALTLLVFETDRGIKDNANYLWNDKYTREEEGNPYDANLGNVYQVDRYQWSFTDPDPDIVPEPQTGAIWFLLGLCCLSVRYLRRPRRLAAELARPIR